MSSTATIERGDKVKLEIEGKHGADNFGAVWVEDTKGNRIYYNKNNHGDNVKLVEKTIVEPKAVGTLVSTSTGARFVRSTDGLWHQVVHAGGIVPLVFSWGNLVVKYGTNLHVLVQKPIGAKPARDIEEWSEEFVTKSGAKVWYRVNEDGSLSSSTLSSPLTADETVELARAILRARNLQA